MRRRWHWSSSPISDDERDRQRILKLTIAYDGRGFAGSQRQGVRRTVQSELERAIAMLWEAEARTVFAGRTDRGVHAAGQVVSTKDFRPDLAERQLKKALNARLPADLAVQSVERRPDGFHARYDAKWREYRYRLWTGTRQPLAEGLVTQRERWLERDAMSDAAAMLVGTHDLAAFAGDGEGVPWSERQRAPRGTVRSVFCCSAERIRPWWPDAASTGELIEIRIVADGFLPKMVRNVVGALMETGRGERPPEWIADLIAGRDRRLAGMTAPADGLILWRIGYDDNESFGTGRDAPDGQ
jgi:tRNA pseudouridine38-40 synthase